MLRRKRRDTNVDRGKSYQDNKDNNSNDSEDNTMRRNRSVDRVDNAPGWGRSSGDGGRPKPRVAVMPTEKPDTASPDRSESAASNAANSSGSGASDGASNTSDTVNTADTMNASQGGVSGGGNTNRDTTNDADVDQFSNRNKDSLSAPLSATSSTVETIETTDPVVDAAVDELHGTSYEDAISELQKITASIQDGSIGVDMLPSTAERGQKLLDHCEQQLRNVEQRLPRKV